ncbi:MAG: CoA-binding protein [Thermoplasmata archaeon]|jgi:acyl-CoA synthetase (NDP forming)|nr:CoA-binding protein [Thermoplasmata archaeon]
MMKSALGTLFRPRSVALVGASANPEKLSNVALRNLLKGDFRVYPINPKERSILGLKCFPSISDVPGEIDLVIISLPAAASVEPTRECVRKGVGVVAVTASGFRESGSEGERLEAELLSSIRGSKTRLLGPNTMGVFVPSVRLDTFFIPEEKSRRPKEGSIAMVSQSGAVSVSFLEKAAASGIGVSACVGLGNKSDINENDVLRYLAEDPATKCIAMYLESFSDGRELVGLAGKISRSKPIVMLKSGRTRAGSFAARSHTGALSSSSDAVVSGILKQAGIARVYDEEELIDVAKALAYVDHIDGNRICVIASAGGFGVIGADYVESCEHGACLRMAELSKNTLAGLRKVAPGFSSVTNPVDLTAGVTDEMYDQALGLLQKDRGVDGIMMSLELQPPHVTDRLMEVAGNRSKSSGAPIVVSAFGGERTQEMLAEFEKRSVPAYPTLWRAIRALKALSDRGTYLKRSK